MQEVTFTLPNFEGQMVTESVDVVFLKDLIRHDFKFNVGRKIGNFTIECYVDGEIIAQNRKGETARYWYAVDRGGVEPQDHGTLGKNAKRHPQGNGFQYLV
tara:strand:- start:56 stop:358 length:303 start_codon:yes stop_codon:yes gene_type:complete